MQKQPKHEQSEQPEPAGAAVVDTGQSPEPAQKTPPPPGHEAHPHEDGKKVKITAAELDVLKAKAAEAEKYYDQFLRSRAEFDNYRKRQAQERQYIELSANERVFQKLLGVLDSIELAVASAEKVNGGKAMVDGIKLLQSQLQAVLRDAGVEEVDALNKKFDPNLHEAIQQIESADHAEGTVVQQVRKGFKFKDRLLRPASVIVSKKPEPAVSAPVEPQKQ
jgi:molecular chaperone GrpE